MRIVDEELVARAQVGQGWAIEELYERFFPIIDKYAKRWKRAFGNYKESFSIAKVKFVEIIHRYDETQGAYWRGFADIELEHAMAKEHRFSKALKRQAILVPLEKPIQSYKDEETKTLQDLIDDPTLLEQVENVSDRLDVQNVLREFLQVANERDLEMYAMCIVRGYENKEIHEITGRGLSTIVHQKARMLQKLHTIAIRRGIIKEAPRPVRGRPRRETLTA